LKTGIRNASGTFVLIADADGQHRPADATRLVAHLGDYDLVVGARSAQSQASLARRAGNATLNRLASFLTEQPIPDLTSGFRAARRDALVEFLHLLPNGFSTPTTTTLAFIKAGYSVRFEPIDAAARRRLEDPPWQRRLSVLPHPAEGDHDLQPAAVVRPDQHRRLRRRRRLRAVDDRHAVARDEFLRAAHPVERDHFPRGSGL